MGMTDRETLIKLAGHIVIPYFAEQIADCLIANGVTVQRWIPVTERLPKLHTDVLVYRRSHCGLGGYMSIEYVTLGHGEARMWSNDFTTYKSAVTHWMPLPQPPKEVE